MHILKAILAAVLFACVLTAPGCAPVAANYPVASDSSPPLKSAAEFDEIERLFADDRMEIIRGPVFEPDAWKQKMEKKRQRAHEAGRLEHFEMVNQMHYGLIDETDNHDVVFRRLGIFMNPTVTATISEGALVLHTQRQGRDTTIADMGIIVPTTQIITSPTQRAFYDSGRAPFELVFTLDETRPDGWPIPIYLRLPSSCHEEEVSRVELGPGWQYDGVAARWPASP